MRGGGEGEGICGGEESEEEGGELHGLRRFVRSDEKRRKRVKMESLKQFLGLSLEGGVAIRHSDE